MEIKQGDRFGKLTVLGKEGNRWRCRCDCGKETLVFEGNLSSGNTKSCGCIRESRKVPVEPGTRFGKLVVVKAEENGKMLCRCDCGNETVVTRTNLLTGNTKSCGCLRHAHVIPIEPGARFGKLIVLEKLADEKYLCRCDCGNERVVTRNNLIQGSVISCGCLHKYEKKPLSVGMRFGKLTVIRKTEPGKYLCKCDCGGEKIVTKVNLVNGHTKSCGCLSTGADVPPGKRFGKLVVIGMGENGKIRCKCDCGNETQVAKANLLRGVTRSCGCLRKERTIQVSPGSRFGRLTVLEEKEDGFLCRCDCGKELMVTRKKLVRGELISCGCMRRKKLMQGFDTELQS